MKDAVSEDWALPGLEPPSPRPYRERWRVRVLFKAPIPLTLILSPQARGEATKISVMSFNS